MGNTISFKHIISLGSFCSVAMEIERIERRDASYPFDWCISDLKGVLQLIDNEFKNFLAYDELMQNTEDSSHYMNQYGIQFFHDFNAYEPLQNQLNRVRKKYLRRINRFYVSIKEPTLFVRYIHDQVEMDYIAGNCKGIKGVLKKFNPQNELVLIANDDMNCYDLPCYKIKKDINDTVARQFLDKNEELKKLFLSIPKQKRRIKYYYRKVIKKIKRQRSKKKVVEKNKYIHNKQYS